MMTGYFWFLDPQGSLAAVIPRVKAQQFRKMDCQGVSQLKTARSSIIKQIFYYQLFHGNWKTLIHKNSHSFADS